MRRFGRILAAIAAFGFAYIAFLYLTLPDVRELRTRNLESTAFMDLRAREARAEGRAPRRVHQWVPYSRISPHLKRAVLVAEDAGFWGHEGIDLVEIKKALETDWERGTLMRGASTITQQLAKNLYLSPTRNPVSKAERTAHHPAPRARVEQDPHLRVVSQQHRVGRRHLGSRGGRAHVLRYSGGRGRARSGRAHGRCDRQSARTEHREAQRATSCASANHPRANGQRHAASGHRDAGAGRNARLRSVRFSGAAARAALRRNPNRSHRNRNRNRNWNPHLLHPTRTQRTQTAPPSPDTVR